MCGLNPSTFPIIIGTLSQLSYSPTKILRSDQNVSGHDQDAFSICGLNPSTFPITIGTLSRMSYSPNYNYQYSKSAVGSQAIYWRRNLTTRLVRPHSPGITTYKSLWESTHTP